MERAKKDTYYIVGSIYNIEEKNIFCQVLFISQGSTL